MSFKDYDAMLNEKIGGPPTFAVGGRIYTCRAKLPWKKFSEFMLSLMSGSAATLAGTEEFFRLCLTAGDRQAFLDALNDEGDGTPEGDAKLISNTQVSDILDDLLDYYTGKAPKNAEGSSVQLPGAGEPSRVVSLTPVADTV